jgi:H+-transporting ATP synthase F0 complex subunit s
MLINRNLFGLRKTKLLWNIRENRSIWHWVNMTFNKFSLFTIITIIWIDFWYLRVDPKRIEEVGPDRAAAEWLLRCGASVKWVKSEKWLSDYNSLPVGNTFVNKIEEIDATDSAIMAIGFSHLSIQSFSYLNLF